MHRRQFIRSMLWGAIAATGASSVFAVEPRRSKITRERIALRGLSRNYRVTAVADIHAPCLYSVLPEIVSVVNSTGPDMVILVGDIIDQSGNEHYIEAFSGISPKLLSLAVLGNWEYYGQTDLRLLKQQYKNAGIKLLVNAPVELQDLMIFGFDDWLLGRPDSALIKKAQSGEKPVLMLSHCPALFDDISASPSPPMVMISGHTHGGQIAPFGQALITPRGSGPYVHGRYHRDGPTLFVTSGIGTSGVPLRIGVQPEILVIDLLPA